MHLIIDVKNLAYRGVWGHPLTTPQGFNVTPLYGFIRSLIAMLKRWPNTKSIIACCDPVDHYETHWRKQMYPQYKAARAAAKANPKSALMKETVAANLPYIRAMCGLLPIRWFEDPACEADDLIAWSLGCLGPQEHKMVVAGDWDMFQLVNYPNVELAVPEHGTKQYARYTMLNYANFSEAIRPMLQRRMYYKATREKHTVGPFPPEYYLPLCCLNGDTSDGIDGLRGVGGARALEIVKLARTKTSSVLPWDLFEAWAQEIRFTVPLPKRLSGIIDQNPDYREILERNYKLMRLDPSTVLDVRKSTYGKLNTQALMDWFWQLNFRSLIPGGELHDDFQRCFSGISY